MGIYEDRQLSAYTRLVEKGQLMAVRERTGKSLDQETGELLVTGTAVDHACYGLFTKTVKSKQDTDKGGSSKGTQATKIVQEIIISNYNPATLLAMTVVVAPNLWLLISGAEHQILTVEPLNPGGIIVLYTVTIAT